MRDAPDLIPLDVMTADGGGNIVGSYICCLRRKLDRGEPRPIHTIRGLGYVVRVPPP